MFHMAPHTCNLQQHKTTAKCMLDSFLFELNKQGYLIMFYLFLYNRHRDTQKHESFSYVKIDFTEKKLSDVNIYCRTVKLSGLSCRVHTQASTAFIHSCFKVFTLSGTL